MKHTIDYAVKNFYSANQASQQAVKMESTDIPKAIQLYQEAEKKFRAVLCQQTAEKWQIDKANEMIAKCSQRSAELMQYISGSPSSPHPQLTSPNTKGKITSSTNITTPTPPNVTLNHHKLNSNDKCKSSCQILSPGFPHQPNIYQTQQSQNMQQSNIYQTQSQVQQPQNIYQTISQVQQPQNIHQTQTQVQQQTNQLQQQNYHQTQVQVQQPTNQPQNIHQTQSQVQSPVNTQKTQLDVQQPTNSQQQQQNLQADQSSNDYQEAYNFLENGLLMDNDGFYDLAKYFYEKSISSFHKFLITAGQINQNNIEFWIYQLRQRNEALDFYSTTSPDASSYYFNTSFHVFDEMKILQTSNNEDAEVLQRKVDKSVSDCISLLKKCIISSQDSFLSNLAKNFLETTMASNMKDNKDESIHVNYVEKIYPDNCKVFTTQKVKNDMAAITSDSSKKFVLVYGPSGTKIINLIQSAAASASIKTILEVNFMKFIGINDNPVNILNTAFEIAKKEAPSYLLLTHIDVCLKAQEKNDNFSTMICDFLISQISAGLGDVTLFCATNMPWMTPINIYQIFNAKVYYPAPDESIIKEILQNNPITQRINDEQLTAMANELVGYTEFGIERILIEAQISNAVKSSGGLRNNICSDIAERLILRNEITLQDIIQAKTYIQPTVAQSGLMFFDQFEDTAK